MEKNPGLLLLLLALSLERKCLRHRLAEPLADEVEGMDHLGSTRIDVHLAPHTGVLPRAASDGIDAPRWKPRELRVGSYALSLISPPGRVYVYVHSAMWAFSLGSSAGSVTTQNRSRRPTFSFPLSS